MWWWRCVEVWRCEEVRRFLCGDVARAWCENLGRAATMPCRTADWMVVEACDAGKVLRQRCGKYIHDRFVVCQIAWEW